MIGVLAAAQTTYKVHWVFAAAVLAVTAVLGYAFFALLRAFKREPKKSTDWLMAVVGLVFAAAGVASIVVVVNVVANLIDPHLAPSAGCC